MVTIYSSLTEHGIHVMDSFEFEYGRILNDLEVEYSTYGVPKYDEDGYITNAILFSSTFRGIYSFLAGMHEYILNNGYFGDEFYIILIRSLGTPDSCSPSSTGLNDDFPKYTVRDQVNFRRQFLFEKFKIKKVLGLVGEGIGAFQFLEWACDYPDEMKFLLIINSAANVSGYRFILSKTFESIIDSADNSDDEYGISKNNAVVAINALLFASVNWIMMKSQLSLKILQMSVSLETCMISNSEMNVIWNLMSLINCRILRRNHCSLELILTISIQILT